MSSKTDEQLDDMIAHVRYEALMLINFLRVGNTSIGQIRGLTPVLAAFVGDSALEAALIHTRCVAEFLRHSGQPEDTITARDYVPDWHWVKGEGLKADLAEIHGRVAHLGLIRRSVQHEGENFNWEEFLNGTAVPTLLDGFREFLGRLDADLVERFKQPKPDMTRIDVAAEITALIGP